MTLTLTLVWCWGQINLFHVLLKEKIDKNQCFQGETTRSKPIFCEEFVRKTMIAVYTVSYSSPTHLCPS